MRLEKLEIHGFKSFAHRVELMFENGITAVVGPNGCGKSNIVDAIRWALGEQSIKSLRGTKQEDIIFAGSERRKPLGLASVTLTFDNSDGHLPLEYQEVAIQRRVFRSGESQFFINGTPCRLRDITELFMDTGLGKETYSIIGQGKIEAVLSAHGQQRRALLEEAAGIYKYRFKKAAALQKVAATEADQARVRDLLAELLEREGPLAEAAQRAQQHAGLAAQLREIDLWLLGQRVHRNQATLQARQAALTEVEQEISEKQAALTEEQAQIQALRMQLQAISGECEERQKQGAHLQAENQRLSGSLNLTQERIQHLEATKKRLLAEKEALLAEREELAARLEELAARREQLAAERELAAAALAAAEAELSERQGAGLSRSEQLEDLKAELIETLQGLASGRNETQNLAGERQRLARRQEKWTEQWQQTERALAELAAAQTEAEASQNQHIERLKALQAQEAKVTARLKEIKAELEAKQAQEKELEATGQRLRARRQVLADWEREHAGYFQGPKAVLSARAELGGIIGTIAELIRVPAAYELAIEIALGSAVQHIVTADDQAAARAIAFLKKQRLGRATFLPLNLIQGSELARREWEGFPGILGPATSLITYEPQYAAAFANLLGRTLVAEDLTAAINMSRQTRARHRLVTLAGELISAGGAISGGTQERKGTSILGRRREIEELDEKLKALAQTQAELARALAGLRQEEAELTQTYKECAAAQHQEELALTALQKEQERLEREGKRLRDEQQFLQAEQTELRQSQGEIEQKQQEVTATLQALEAKRVDLEAQLQALQAETNVQTAADTALQERLTELKLQVSRLEQNEATTANELLQTQAQQKRVANKLEAHTAELTKLEQESIQLVEERERLKSEVEEGRKQFAACEEDLKQSQQARAAAQALLEKQEEAYQAVSEAIRQLEGKFHRLELEIARLQEEGAHVAELLAERYQYTIADLPTDPKPPAGYHKESEVKQGLAALQRELAALGPVNPDAVAEHAALVERITFLKGQLADLDQARAELAALIAEIDTTSRKRFLATFEAVNKALAQIFARLFPEGRAWLELASSQGETDPLEQELVIMAQIPGKKVQNLDLLSGGERALTAIAFLFAMLEVKPPPFCILDETDAALDDANLRRYAQLLRLFAQRIQFIIITHRRVTMEAAAALYGVTMEEAGVSQLVSLRLEEGKEHGTQANEHHWDCGTCL